VKLLEGEGADAQTEFNKRDDDDAKYFVLGMTFGVLIGTVSTFFGNIMSHRWLQGHPKDND